MGLTNQGPNGGRALEKPGMCERHGSWIREEGGPQRLLMYRAHNFVLHPCSQPIERENMGLLGDTGCFSIQILQKCVLGNYILAMCL